MRLFLPPAWLKDPSRLARAGVLPEERRDLTKGQIALQLLDQARAERWPRTRPRNARRWWPPPCVGRRSSIYPLAAGAWDRLTAYLHEHKQLTIQRSRVGAILLQEGLRWRKQETWFGAERVDPDFARKRPPSSGSTPRRRQPGGALVPLPA